MIKLLLYYLKRGEISMEQYLLYFVDIILHLDKHLPEIMMAYGHFDLCNLIFSSFSAKQV